MYKRFLLIMSSLREIIKYLITRDVLIRFFRI